MDEGHPDVHRLFLAVYKNFIEVVTFIDVNLYFIVTNCNLNFL